MDTKFNTGGIAKEDVNSLLGSLKLFEGMLHEDEQSVPGRSKASLLSLISDKQYHHHVGEFALLCTPPGYESQWYPFEGASEIPRRQ